LRKQKNINLDHDIPYDILVGENIAGLLYLENDTIVFSNVSFAEVLDATIHQIRGTSILDWVADSAIPLLKEGLEDIFSGRKNEFSKNLERKGDHNTFLSLHLRVVERTEDGVMMVGASRNSTKQVNRNIELHREQTRYDSLFENTLAGIIIYNYDKDEIVECNKVAMDLMGYKNKEELLGMSRLEFVPDTSPHFSGVEMHKETKKHGYKIKAGISFNTRGVFLTKKGKSFLVQTSVTPTFYEYGEGFIIFHDITSEILNKRSKRIIEKKHKDIFDNSHEAIIYMDVKTTLPSLCNDNALKLFEVDSLDELRAKNLEDYIHDDMLEGMTPKEYVKYKKAVAIQEGKAEISFWKKTEDQHLVRINGLLISNLSNAKAPKIIIFLRDVTYSHNAQIALNKKNEQLKIYIDSNMQLENFAYLASHDLQTPLRSIISFTQLLEKRLGNKLSEEEREYLDFIVDSGRSMRNLINDLLSYSMANTTKINLTVINLQKLLKQIQAELIYDINKKNAIINVNQMPKKIIADSSKIKQIFQNLIINAIKFSSENLKSIIEINGIDNGSNWLFSIKDNGIGIEKQYQEKIFLLFKRLNEISKYEGTGIGLAMVKKIVEQHDGKIWLESEIGKGATFFFTIKKH
jgi:PAS domain S-box-containing protein